MKKRKRKDQKRNKINTKHLLDAPFYYFILNVKIHSTSMISLAFSFVFFAFSSMAFVDFDFLNP
jgi:hypothetical protein